MSCVLRISGVHLNIDELMEKIDLPFEKPFHKGTPKSKHHPDLGVFDKSGCNVLVSSAGFSDLPNQHSDAEDFFRSRAMEIEKLNEWPHIETLVIDFGTELNPETVSKYISPPKTLVRLIAKTNIDLEYSVYRTTNETS